MFLIDWLASCLKKKIEIFI